MSNENKSSKNIIKIIVIIVILIIVGVGIYYFKNLYDELSDNKVVKYEDIGNNMIFFKCPACNKTNYISLNKMLGPDKIYDTDEYTYLYYCLECRKALIFRPESMTVATQEFDKEIHNLNDEEEIDTAQSEPSYNTENQETNENNYTTGKKEIEPGLTGIEQAVKDGQIGEDYISEGVSKETLHFAWSDGNLSFYYDNWEDCLQDAEDLGILREATQEELDALNSGI